MPSTLPEHAHPYLKEAFAITPLLQKHRRYLHQNAEVGFHTEKANAYIQKELSALGIPHRMCGGGVLAVIGEGKSNVLLRAETDALPIQEQTALPFAGTNAMHACGHDMHAAMLLGAAKLLAERKDTLKARITLLFQPAEEILKGACSMIEDGALSPMPCAAVTLHVLTACDLPVGTLLIPPSGKVSAAADFFRVQFHGKATHGAMPEAGNNPILPAAHAAAALPSLPAGCIGVDRETLLTLGSFRAGKTANAIPETALLQGSLRTHDKEARALLQERMHRLCHSTADAFSCEAEIFWDIFCPALRIDERTRKEALSVLTHVLGKERVKALPPFVGKPRGGSEDFANLAEKVPALLISLAAGERREGYAFPLHHPKTTFDENALPYGTAAFTALATALGILRA